MTRWSVCRANVRLQISVLWVRSGYLDLATLGSDDHDTGPDRSWANRGSDLVAGQAPDRWLVRALTERCTDLRGGTNS